MYKSATCVVSPFILSIYARMLHCWGFTLAKNHFATVSQHLETSGILHLKGLRLYLQYTRAIWNCECTLYSKGDNKGLFCSIYRIQPDVITAATLVFMDHFTVLRIFLRNLVLRLFDLCEREYSGISLNLENRTNCVATQCPDIRKVFGECVCWPLLTNDMWCLAVVTIFQRGHAVPTGIHELHSHQASLHLHCPGPCYGNVAVLT